jgi:crotonobetainyl-CoA:carnitine CoA-transferase CaiB-like acyl-CoA transferase
MRNHFACNEEHGIGAARAVQERTGNGRGILMNRQQQDLDRYITGNYGEDQFRSDEWPELNAHRLNWETHNNPHVYEYDPTDDGPEIEIVARIKAAYPRTWDGSLRRILNDSYLVRLDRMKTECAARRILEDR